MSRACLAGFTPFVRTFDIINGDCLHNLPVLRCRDTVSTSSEHPKALWPKRECGVHRKEFKLVDVGSPLASSCKQSLTAPKPKVLQISPRNLTF